ncbi:MAG: hypothetical protein MUF85_03555 [Patescibacteria group bacterium]|jgi:hypothetical protein|nr:hypothetical protein [Patescibacteria group bacterium]
METQTILDQIKADIVKDNVCPDCVKGVTGLVFGLGISMTVFIEGGLSLLMLIFWPILFIAMPFLYIIGKRSE